ADGGLDLGAEELGGRVVGVLAGEQVRKRRVEAEAAAAPAALVRALPLFRRHLEGRLVVALDDEADARLAGLAPELRVARLHLPLVFRIQGGVSRRDAEVRGPLEDEEAGRLPGDDRDRLDGGGARADDADPLAGEVDTFVRPVARVMPRALE